MIGSSILCDFAGIGPARRIVDFDHLAVGLGDLVAHAGGGGDEVEIEFALEALLDDLHVEQAEEAAAEAEAESDGAFRLEEEGGIVEAQLLESVAEHACARGRRRCRVRRRPSA